MPAHLTSLPDYWGARSVICFMFSFFTSDQGSHKSRKVFITIRICRTKKSLESKGTGNQMIN